jgi:molybdopterin molybdotransferase
MPSSNDNPSSQSCDTGQTLLSIDETLKQLLERALLIAKSAKTSTLPLNQALGSILATDLRSNIQVPPLDNSAMDGYAVNTSDLSDAHETQFEVSQRIPAGSIGKTLKQGTAARIFTGAPIPEGANAVVMQEVCQRDGDIVTITGSLSSGKNIRKAGEDIDQEDIVLTAGTKLRPQDIGLAASVGISQIPVFEPLKVAIFSTGDELREPGETLEAGQIYNSNRYTLTGLLQSLDCTIIDLGIIEDTLEATKNALQKAAEQADLVMTSGGVSVGEEDHIRKAVETLGKLELWRVNIKPGKPLAFGHLKTAQGNTAFLGLPGNPVSVFTTFCVFAHPFILQAQGCSKTEANYFQVVANFTWKKAGSRNEYLRARVEKGQVELYPHQGSGVLSSTTWANGFVFIPADRTIKKGESVRFIAFSELGIA